MSEEDNLNIPRFLICDSHDQPDRHFLMHTNFPKFLAEAKENTDGTVDINVILWLEDKEVLDVSYNAKLMREMGVWYVEELNSYDDLN